MADGDATDMAKGLDLLRSVDPCAAAREQLRKIAAAVGEWAGIPFVLEGGPALHVEPSYPYASVFERPEDAAVAETVDGWQLRSSFYSMWRRAEILVLERDGKIDWGIVPQVHSLNQQLQTLSAAEVWGLEQEGAAVSLLGSMLRHHQFKSYLLTGAFVERSPRSGVIYMFRKLRPTVAMTLNGRGVRRIGEGRLSILAALCMHPIGYYENSWAGAMCPTDDVVAHLSMMRADERMLWRRCNQHPAFMAAAGL